jgi:hypothetical protein
VQQLVVVGCAIESDNKDPFLASGCVDFYSKKQPQRAQGTMAGENFRLHHV